MLRIMSVTHNCFTILEHELLIELSEVEPILTLSTLNVDLAQELSDEFDDFWQSDFVGIVFWRVLEARFEE